jgi:hypothetical protein
MANFQARQRFVEGRHSLLSLAIMLARRADLKKAASSVLAARLRPSFARHCEEPTGPARSGRPDDRLRDEAIQRGAAEPVSPCYVRYTELDCFASLAMTKREAERRQAHLSQCSASADAARALS